MTLRNLLKLELQMIKEKDIEVLKNCKEPLMILLRNCIRMLGEEEIQKRSRVKASFSFHIF